jgi:hypothetical protein
MKATTIFIAVVLTLQVNVLFAGNTGVENSSNEVTTLVSASTLAPVTPNEADFSDVVPEAVSGYTNLAPVTPTEADFSDVTTEVNVTLSPVTPTEADFNDTLSASANTNIDLAPAKILAADFN